MKTKKRKSKKTARKQRRSNTDSVELDLTHRIAVGLSYKTPVDVEDGQVAMYILNPKIRGPREVVSGTARTRPAFDSFSERYDKRIRDKLGIDDRYELAPFWMGRFIASTNEGLMFGYTMRSKDQPGLIINTLTFDYALCSELFEVPIGKLKLSPVSNDIVLEALEWCGNYLRDRTGLPFTLTCNQVVDPGYGSWVRSTGGEA